MDSRTRTDWGAAHCGTEARGPHPAVVRTASANVPGTRTDNRRVKSAIVLAISGILRRQELRRRPRQPPPARRVDASSCHDWCHVRGHPDNACLPGLSFQASSFHIIQLAERVRSWLQPPGCLPCGRAVLDSAERVRRSEPCDAVVGPGGPDPARLRAAALLRPPRATVAPPRSDPPGGCRRANHRAGLAGHSSKRDGYGRSCQHSGQGHDQMVESRHHGLRQKLGSSR